MSDEEIPFQLEPIAFRDDDGSWRPRIRVYVEFPDHGLEEIVLESREEVTFDEESQARTYSERLGLKYLLDRAREDAEDDQADGQLGRQDSNLQPPG